MERTELIGADGQDGYTPVRGTDYWTETEQNEIISTATTNVENNFASTIATIQSNSSNALNTANTANNTANTAKSIAEGANQALSYTNYQAMITAFNELADNVYKVGQNIMIITLNVPDLWISAIENTSITYNYTNDEAITTALSTNGYIQVGYYKLSALETQKVDLTDYYTKTGTENKIEDYLYKIMPTDSASGAIATIDDATTMFNAIDVSGTIEPVQAGSGDPSPDNVRPITGWTGCKVTRTGKNLLDTSDTTHSKYNIGSIPNILKPNTTYTYSVNGNTTNKFRLYTAKSTAPLSALTPLNIGYISKSDGAQTFTTPSTMDDLLCLAGNSSEAGNESLANILPQLELGSTATPYEPYQSETYDITFPSEAGTVYGGSLDVTTGLLTVDRAMVDLGTLNWSYNTTYAFFMSKSLENRAKGITNLKSDLFKTTAGSWSGTPLQNAIWGNGSNITIYVQIPPYDNVADFVQLVAGHQLVYELATPITYQLTPQQISFLLGTNNLWVDTGDINVTYKADIQKYIDKKTN